MTTKNYFEKNAEKFDSIYIKESFFKTQINKILRPSIYRRIELSTSLINKIGSQTILDIGCGSGRAALHFISAGASSVHGIDFSETMLKLARSHIRVAEKEHQINFEKADFLSWDSCGRQWDLTIALGVFDYLDDILPALQKMYQVSKIGVCFTIRYPSIRMPIRKLRYQLKGCQIFFYKKDFIESKCKEAGFKLVLFVDGGGASYFVTAYKED